MNAWRLLCFAATALSAFAADTTRRLKQAIVSGDAAAVVAAAEVWKAELGGKAGVPERAETFTEVPAGAVILSPEEARRRMAELKLQVEGQPWRPDILPEDLTVPLRVPASVLSGCAVAVRGGGESCRQTGAAAVEFLLRAQQEAGTGGFPFPASRGPSKAKAMQVAAAFLRKAEAAGKLDEVVHKGWIVNDAGDGGLQFDNAECGVAMLDWYAATKDGRCLESARRAGEWAARQPLCVNWNYNSFSVWLLARLTQVTGEAHWRDAALRKARAGVMPGQLTAGTHAGRWADAHNACAPYHYIMMLALTELAGVLPAESPARAEVAGALHLGLKARNGEIVTRGVMNRDKAMEALLEVQRVFGADAAFLRETQSSEALEVLARLISSEAQRGREPLAPREWTQFLAWAAGR